MSARRREIVRTGITHRDRETGELTRHSLADVEAILDAHYLGRTTKLAVSAVAKLERAAAMTRTDDERKLQNKVQNGQSVPGGKTQIGE